MSSTTWFVTGASKGMGRHITEAALAAGHRVVATSRSPEQLTADIGSSDRFLAVPMALTDETEVAAAVHRAEEHFGGIDVLVNNAGYSVLGAVEEFSDAEVRANFDVNVFGLLSVIRAALPSMRRRRRGHILNLASISADVTSPATGVYSATKAAVLMLTEALAEEIAPLGLRATAICPGGVRTDFLDSSSSRRPGRVIDGYDSVRRVLDGLDRLNHRQGGDPALVARALLTLVEQPDPPTRLYLGSDALGAIRHQTSRVRADADRWATLTTSTDG